MSPIDTPSTPRAANSLIAALSTFAFTPVVRFIEKCCE